LNAWGLRIVDDVGIEIHKLTHLKLQGKLPLADGVRAIIGSIILAPGSFDTRRELAIEMHDDDIIERLQQVVRHDWENSHPLDLKDAGLLVVDLEDTSEVERIALEHYYGREEVIFNPLRYQALLDVVLASSSRIVLPITDTRCAAVAHQRVDKQPSARAFVPNSSMKINCAARPDNTS
jgi:hypothetical protein